MKRILLPLFSLLPSLSASAQSVKLLPQQKLSRWNIPAGSYSGITPIGEDRYAVVSDAAPRDGWYEFRIEIAPSGDIDRVQLLGIRNNDLPARDAEGIAFFPDKSTLFISAENDQQIYEYHLNGLRTGRSLAVPEQFGSKNIVANYGFEALAYSPAEKLFWTTTENTLQADGIAANSINGQPARLRLQSFGTNLEPKQQYIYLTDAPVARKAAARYAFGVPAITAMPDGSLLVLEREFFVANHGVGSFVNCNIYQVRPDGAPSDQPLEKKLLASWRTSLSATRQDIANYEGMCLGPQLPDGRQTIILIADSQNGYGNSLYHLKDFIRVGIIER